MNNQPELIIDPDTGLYDVVLDGRVVYARLDPVGKREEICRHASDEVDHG